MNETRKAIIKLIEPFMDKTLSEGCIIYDTEKGYYLNYKKDIINGIHEKEIEVGHYDITAVLKYLENKIIDKLNPDFNTQIGNNYIYLDNDCKNIFEGEGEKIPNKPLHLYTEEEEKHLLIILNKLNEM